MNSFSKTLLTAAFIASGFAASVALAQDKWDANPWIDGKPVTLKAGYNSVRQYPHARAIERFVNRVAERTGENLRIQTFPSEQAGNERQMFDAVTLGTLDIAKVSTGVITTAVPEFGVLDLPYVFRDLNHMMATLKGKVGQDLTAKLEARNVKILFWMEQGTRSFYTASKPIRTPADLKGMKIRTIATPVMVDTINALGATATPMGFGDLYLGLKSGIVDGAENSPDAIWYAKHQEVAKYFTITNHFRTPVIVVMNKAKFDALSPEYKEIVMTSARETQEWAGALYSEVSKTLMASLKKAGMTIIETDEEAFRKAVEPVYAKHGQQFAAQLKEIREIK